MQRYIAFLRAINVGGHTVKMDRLRKLFVDLGLEQVETFIASGNVIFCAVQQDARALEKRLETHLQENLGYPVATFIRTPAELAAISSYEAFPPVTIDPDDHTLYMMFLGAEPEPQAADRLAALTTPEDAFAIHAKELYWRRRDRLSESKITGGMLEKALAMPGTLRNRSTVRKLAEKYAPDQPGG